MFFKCHTEWLALKGLKAPLDTAIKESACKYWSIIVACQLEINHLSSVQFSHLKLRMSFLKKWLLPV